MSNLENKNIIVTGASGGIGNAIIDVICKKRHHYHFITFVVVHFNFSFRKKTKKVQYFI